MSKNPIDGFPPIRRVLVLKVRADGKVRAMRIALRAGCLTYRRSAGLLGDDNAAAAYAGLFADTSYDSICPRIFTGGRWRNPLRVNDAEQINPAA